MKKQNVLLVWFLAVAFAFSACQKSTAENNQSQFITTPTPDEKLLIRNIDFKNFTYSDRTGKDIFTLTNGKEPFGQMKDIAFSLKSIEYADLTNDKENEAIIHILIEYGAGSSGLLYIFTVENQKPKMLWYVESGYGSEGELKSAYAESNSLIVELFGDNSFVEAKDEFKFPNQNNVPKKLCCPTDFTRFRFIWNSEKFVIEGKPELLQVKNQNKEN